MTIQLQWLNEEKTILHHIYTNVWTWDEFHASFTTMREMIADIDRPFDQIIDLSNSRLMPQGNLITNMRKGGTKLPSNSRAVAIVGDNLFLGIASRIIASVSRPNPNRPIKIFKTLDEAVAWLATVNQPK